MAEVEIKKQETQVQKFFNKKENVWMTVAGVLLVLLIIVSILAFTGKGDSVSSIQGKVVAFAEEQDVSLEIQNITLKGNNLYEVNVLVEGQAFPLYVTKDGNFLFQAYLFDLKPSSAITGNAVKDSSATTEVPKTDKPVVEAFVFSYCPYGLQFQKALLPAYNLLKNKADIELVAIGAMHGEFEKQESLRQIAIQELYGKDKLWQYLEKFMAETDLGEGTCRQEASCTDPIVNGIMKQLGIDSAKVSAYMKSNSEKIYNEQNDRSAELGISGSPTFVINGVQVSVSRSPDAVKQAICDAFTTAPSECSTTLSTTQSSSWFGTDAGSTSSGSC